MWLNMATGNSFIFPGLVLSGGIAVFYVIAVLFGAPIFSQFYETMLWSTLMSSLIFIPCLTLLQWTPNEWTETLLFIKSRYTMRQFYCAVNAIAVLTGSWIGAAVLLLDWDTQWKVWPIPCYIGSLLGGVVSLLIVIMRRLFW
ncbi:PREDICTED: phosphatidylinositol-glycan biosynthesis class F protein-like isoform X2 [Amphimedon queenslandica]|uniref:Uncharacterized protein n=1 Tax=Amphimedon queenslandica TaxID=400682 RepID=A0AAN0K508_AMPQE|nr:PREDICTED: phosphatidylinositol-glycan biosynthesis class F protein-like isoform X2 [Amphimedon queenslandica]|eukprot:XP_019864289.1 PREDICTED: phosphatidylinositol-glycan biosynthesis class F protein-like isoform X2 [Amphimedon queenslandica]